MSTMTERSADIADAETPGRPYRIWMVGLVSGAFGIGFGIAVTVGTVVMPRKAELRREKATSTILSAISIDGALKAVDPKLTWVQKQETQEISYGYGWPQTPSRGLFGTLKVPASEQIHVIDRLAAELFAEVQKSSQFVQLMQMENPTYQAGPNQLNVMRGYNYARARGSGTIRVWGIGRGDELSVVVSVSDR